MTLKKSSLIFSLKLAKIVPDISWLLKFQIFHTLWERPGFANLAQRIFKMSWFLVTLMIIASNDNYIYMFYL